MKEGYTGIPETQQPKTNVIDFEAAAKRVRETREDQHMRRSLMRPVPRTDMERREVAGRRQSIREAIAREEGEGTAQPAPLALSTVQERIDKNWLHDFLKTRFYSSEQHITDEQWTRLKHLDPTLHDDLKENVRLENRIKEIRLEAGGNQLVFDELWQKELEAFRAIERRKRDEEEVRQRKLPAREETREQAAERLTNVGFRPPTRKQWREWKRMKHIDPQILTKDQWNEWRWNPLSMTEEEVKQIEERQELQRKREQWNELAIQNGWSKNPDDPEDHWYVQRIVDRAERLGLNPLTLTPEDRKELTEWGRILSPQERERIAVLLEESQADKPR